MRERSAIRIQATEEERGDGEDEIMGAELSDEELARLDQEMEETYLTGATPILDALVPDMDRHDENLLETFHNEVVRRLGNEVDLFDDDLFKHVEQSFKRGRSEDQCVAEWRTRLS